MTEFERIYQDYFRHVELYLLALCKDETLAEELTAQVFYRALHALPKFRGNCSVSTWLCAIAKNAYITQMSKHRTDVPLDAITIPDTGKSVEERIIDNEQAALIHQVLHSLPEPYKEVFSLRVFAQLPFSEIGTLFGRNQNWACVTYYRARKKIQAALEEYNDERL